jgi:CHAT domain-containing protein/tetratricopeptide (TPR) repeat protein
LFVNTNHGPSISRNRSRSQPPTQEGTIRPLFLTAIVCLGWPLAAAAADGSCLAALGAAALTRGPLKTQGTEPAAVVFPLAPGKVWLIEVEEEGNDALVEVLDATGAVLARADHPERRTGTRRAVLTTPGLAPLTVRITGKEHAGVAGTATIRAFDLAALETRPECLAVLRSLAQADSDYASGQEISRGRAASPAYSARDAYLRAAQAYSSAERALVAAADRPLRGQTQLARAAVEYYELQDWAKTAEWAQAAAATLGHDDPYRRARAQALLAAAWLEIGESAPHGRVLPEYGVDSTDLLTRARRLLRSLSGYHLERGERYDAGLQLTNIGLTYLYQSRFPECIAASSRSSELFGSIHEARKQAQAWQNEALCLWGLGRLPEALRLLERARADISPEPYPRNFISVTTNTALVNYALGHFDESLRLYDLALPYARKIQSPRDEAFCLYGLGVNYYALGARARAREFLERALAIRTVALDGRGRMATLRALATIDADEGRLDEALAYDREALTLAVGPSSIGRIRIQLAVHTAAAGHPEEAIGELTEVIGTGAAAGVEPVVQAEALLQRGVLYRQTDRPREAFADLGRARPRLHRLGSITEEFAADLELSRTLRLRGQTNAALAAVDRTLGLAAAVRAQTANPELRAQLQTPLRAAYDLRIELLRARFEDAMAAGHTQDANTLAAAAFATADASRAHSLADVAAQEYPPAIRQALASELRRREALYGELAGRRFRLASLLDSSGARDPTARHLIADVAELERQLDAINTAIAARAAPHSGSRPMHGGNLPRLPVDTALISYWLGSESAYVWVSVPPQLDWQRLPAPAAIAEQALAFHRSLTRLVDVPPERRLAGARALSELILRPIEASLGKVHTWIVVPDGALDYVPFAALRVLDAPADAPVIARHDLAFTPAAWMLEGRPPRVRARDAPQLLLVADPVYQADDPRLTAVRRVTPVAPPATREATDAARELQRLPFTAEEAAGIVAQFPRKDVDELIGVDATRARLLSLDWSRYRFIHIATHGRLDAQVPQLSALVLGSYDAGGNTVDGAVRVADLSLRTIAADVAVFSACETALGKEVPSEGLVGITSTVLARGARAVVASLWPVSDEMGARLMTDFYRHLLHDSMSPAAALGASMRSVVAHDASADPALWAAYQVSVVALGPGQPTGSTGPVTATSTRP